MIKANLEAEQSVIGAMLLDPVQVVPKALESLTAEDFSHQGHQAIFRACKGLFLQDKPIDPVTVLGQTGEELKLLLVQCCEAVPTTRNVDSYLALVQENARKRRAHVLAVELLDQLEGMESAEECQAKATRLCESLSQRGQESTVSAKEGFLRFYSTKMVPRSYLKTGLSRLDRYIYLDRGDYVVVGGRPSSGKTALTLQIALSMAKELRVVYFSLETSALKLYDRLAAHYTMTPFGQVKTGNIQNWAQVARCADSFSKLTLWVVEAAGWTVEQVRAKAAQLRADVVFIDYLSLLKGEGKSLYERVTNISLGLHTMAQRSKVLVVALSQLSRGEGEPTMTSLRESGQIEQDADVILLLHTINPREENAPRRLIIAKNKEGGVGIMDLCFSGDYQRFYEEERRFS